MIARAYKSYNINELICNIHYTYSYTYINAHFYTYRICTPLHIGIEYAQHRKLVHNPQG